MTNHKPATKRIQAAREKKARSVGRPRHVLEEMYQIRMSKEDRARFEAAAREAGLELSQWIRLQCATSLGAKVIAIDVAFRTEYPTTGGLQVERSTLGHSPT